MKITVDGISYEGNGFQCAEKGCYGNLIPIIKQRTIEIESDIGYNVNKTPMHERHKYESKPELIWKCARCGSLIDDSNKKVEKIYKGE